MKNLLTFIILSIFAIVSHGQIKYTPQYVPQPYVPMNDLKLMQQVLNAKQALYDENMEELYEMQNYILDKQQVTNDIELINIYNKYYAKLDKLKGTDLSLATEQLKQINLDMKKETIDYSLKNKTQDFRNNSSTSNSKTKSAYHSGQKLVSQKGIGMVPTPDMTVATSVKVSKGELLEIIKILDNEWLFVKNAKGDEGYLKCYWIE